MVSLHSDEYLMTMLLHSALYLSSPISMTACFPEILNFLSISCSMGRPWVSQPKRRST